MISARKAVLMLLSAVFPGGVFLRAQQPMNMPQEQMHHHGDTPPVLPIYPRLGHAQELATGKLFTLDEAQRLAAESNPTLRQAEAEVRAAKARTQQAGLYPNPSVGYAGDEIRGGSINGGKQGFFAEQTIVTGGKLGKNRAVFESEAELAGLEEEEQRMRVQNAVKAAYFRVLSAQELLDTRTSLAQIEQNYAEVQRQLFNTGQADESEVLEAEVDAGRRLVSARIQENTLHEEWKSLAAVIGRPDLTQAVVAGDLAHAWPEIDEEQVLEIIALQAPAARIAKAAGDRAAAEILRAKSQAIPDLQLRGGLQYNNEPLGILPQAIGWEGFAELGVQLPIFNRNQGNVAVAAADLDRAQFEKQRVALTLRERAATVVDEYASAKLLALEYRDELLPREQKAYTLLAEKYGLMLAAYPRVLDAKRKLFALHAEYIMALETTWITGIALQGFLLTDGLEAPSHPSEVDRPLRETNLPMPERTASPSERMSHP
jgi:outer membrane protein, heavy metal efflux system